MITEFQKKKMQHFFNVFDTDKDGFLEQADLERVIQKLAAVQNLEAGSPTYDNLHAKWMFVWNTLQKVSDANRDNLVSPEEWITLVDMTLTSEEAYQQIMYSIGSSTFDAVDTNNDGIIGVAEWTAFFKAHDIDEAVAEETFARLDLNSDGHISKDEGLELLHQFFYNNDPETPGNLFFGPF